MKVFVVFDWLKRIEKSIVKITRQDDGYNWSELMTYNRSIKLQIKLYFVIKKICASNGHN